MITCKEEGCQVSITGKCVNGLDLLVCPHVSKDESEENETVYYVEDEPETPFEDGSVDVHSGFSIPLEEINKISTRAISRLIILAGMPDAGKTTLLISILHLFATRDDLEGFMFAGSETLLDFESKSHPSRLESENENATTARTPIKDPQFLHLRIADQSRDNEITELLLTDISGEQFKSFMDSTLECEKFKIGNRADHFVLFFDTSKIASLSERQSARTSGLSILKSLIEANRLVPNTRIQIIFSKWDLGVNGDGFDVLPQFIELVKKEIERLCIGFEIEFFEIAARPSNGGFEFGYGIEKIFPKWVKSSILDFKLKSVNKDQVLHQREYLNYKLNN